MLRTDVKRMIIFFLHCYKYLSKRMIGKFDVSISIPPFEHSIVKRLIFFDEIILEIERFALRFYDQKIKMICYFEHFLFSKGSWSKILRNSFFQIFCFPNVKHGIFLIFEKIDSRLFRKFIEMIGDEHEERSEVKYFDCIIMGKEIKRKTYFRNSLESFSEISNDSRKFSSKKVD